MLETRLEPSCYQKLHASLLYYTSQNNPPPLKTLLQNFICVNRFPTSTSKGKTNGVMRSCDVDENSLGSWSGGPPATVLALRGLSLPGARYNLLETRTWRSGAKSVQGRVHKVCPKRCSCGSDSGRPWPPLAACLMWQSAPRSNTEGHVGG